MNALLQRFTSERRDLGWLLGEKVVLLAFALTSSVLLARYLGPRDFGLLSALTAAVSLALPLASLGLNAVVVRELVDEARSEAVVLGTCVFLRLLGGVFATVALLGLYLSVDDFAGVDRLVLLLFAGVGFAAAFGVHEYWFQARVANHRLARLRMVVFGSFLGLKLVAITFEAGRQTLYVIVAAEMLALPLAVAAACWMARRDTTGYRIDLRYGAGLLRSSSWLILSAFTAAIYLKVDVLMLLHLRGGTEAGLYTTASKLSEIWYQLPLLLCTVLFPHMLRLRKQSRDAYDDFLQVVYGLLFWSALLLVLAVAIVGETLVVGLFGEPYRPAVAILHIHIWACLFIFMRALLSKWLIAESLFAFSLLSHGIGALINVGLNWPFIQWYGGIGAAWATVVSYAVASTFALLLSRSTLPAAKMMLKAPLLPITVLSYRGIKWS